METLEYSALLRGLSADNLQYLVKSLGLQSSLDVQVGSALIRGLSGGQKRRLTLGCELIDPRCRFLFLDEPTSGLDAKAAASIVALIVNISKERGVAVIMCVHQPSSHVFHSFDRVLVLSEGRVAYNGPSKKALAYFTDTLGIKMKYDTMNPADFILEVVNADFRDKKEVLHILDRWSENEPTRSPLADVKKIVSSRQNANEQDGCVFGFSFYRTGILIKRANKTYFKNPELYLLRFGLYGFMSLFLGATYVLPPPCPSLSLSLSSSCYAQLTREISVSCTSADIRSSTEIKRVYPIWSCAFCGRSHSSRTCV